MFREVVDTSGVSCFLTQNVITVSALCRYYRI